MSNRRGGAAATARNPEMEKAFEQSRKAAKRTQDGGQVVAAVEGPVIFENQPGCAIAFLEAIDANGDADNPQYIDGNGRPADAADFPDAGNERAMTSHLMSENRSLAEDIPYYGVALGEVTAAEAQVLWAKANPGLGAEHIAYLSADKKYVKVRLYGAKSALKKATWAVDFSSDLGQLGALSQPCHVVVDAQSLTNVKEKDVPSSEAMRKTTAIANGQMLVVELGKLSDRASART